MSERDPTPLELKAAFKSMADQKARGEWDTSRGDIPRRIGPLPIPEGYRTLSEMADGWALMNRATQEADETAAVVAVTGALASGEIESFAVGQAGELHRIPRLIWRQLLEEPGGSTNANRSIAFDCLTGGAFEPSYEGGMGVVTEATYQRWAQSSKGAAYPDADRPWLAFNSPKAWLKDPVAATRFADALLTAQGQTTMNERARRRVLGAHLEAHGVHLGPDTVAANRREGGHKV